MESCCYWDRLWNRLFYRSAVAIVGLIILGSLGLLSRQPTEQEKINNAIARWEQNKKTQTSCVTPSGAKGTCINVDLCFSKNVLHQANCTFPTYCCPDTDDTYEFVSRICTSPKDPGCRSTTHKAPSVQIETTTERMCKMTYAPPDPATQCCGLETQTNGIKDGSTSTMDHYPWTVVLEYEIDGLDKARCTGSLISGRYVLTAAQCVDNETWTLKGVRLGNYNTSNVGNGCVKDGCNDTENLVTVQSAKLHPLYERSSILKPHDVALLKLDRLVDYTDFVRPICLPSIDFTKSPSADDVLYVPGWRANNTSDKFKLPVELGYVPYLECHSSFKDDEMEIGATHICAVGVENTDSCTRVHAGPLMRRNGKVMELVGIDKLVLDGCSKNPYVYTKVSKYLSWIKSNIVE